MLLRGAHSTTSFNLISDAYRSKKNKIILDARAQVMFSQSLKRLPISGRGSMNYLKKL
jgi:hypothetical protein